MISDIQQLHHRIVSGVQGDDVAAKVGDSGKNQPKKGQGNAPLQLPPKAAEEPAEASLVVRQGAPADRIEKGQYGVKNGAGFYDYSNGKDEEKIEYRDQMFTKLAKCLYE